jgi:hypothetical protein
VSRTVDDPGADFWQVDRVVEQHLQADRGQREHREACQFSSPGRRGCLVASRRRREQSSGHSDHPRRTGERERIEQRGSDCRLRVGQVGRLGKGQDQSGQDEGGPCGGDARQHQ